jgi:hypothetical protein
MMSATPPESTAEPAVVVAERPRIPRAGDTVFLYAFDPFVGFNAPVQSFAGTITKVDQPGDPHSPIDLQVMEEEIDVYLPIHHQQNATRLNKWVWLITDEFGFEKQVRHNPARMELPPVGSFVGLLKPVGGQLAPVKVRVVGHVPPSDLKLKLATPGEVYRYEHVPLSDVPKAGHWGWAQIELAAVTTE